MKDKSILVLYAGSSSLKSSVFQPRNATDLDLQLRGSVDGLGGAPARISARDGDGQSLIDRPLKPSELKAVYFCCADERGIDDRAAHDGLGERRFGEARTDITNNLKQRRIYSSESLNIRT